MLLHDPNVCVTLVAAVAFVVVDVFFFTFVFNEFE